MVLDKNIVKQFVDFVVEELEIEKTPRIVLTTNKSGITTTALYRKRIEIKIYVKGRHLVDVLRSIAHELVHHRQLEQGKFGDEKVQDVGGDIEDEANAVAGQLIKKFAYSGNMKIYEIQMKTLEVLNEARLKKDFKTELTYRYFDIYVPGRNGFSAFIRIPEEEANQIWDFELNDQVEAWEGEGVIDWAIANKLFDYYDGDPEYVREIDKDEYCLAVGNYNDTPECKKLNEARLRKPVRQVDNKLALPLGLYLDISPYELEEVSHDHYGLTQFETEGGEVYAIGTDEEADNAFDTALEYIKDDIKTYISPTNLWRYIDDNCAEQWAESERDYFDEIVRENPKYEIDDDPEQMTDYATEEIERIIQELIELNGTNVHNEDTINEMKEEITILREKMDMMLKEPTDNYDDDLYNEMESRISDLEEDIETLTDEIEDNVSQIEELESEKDDIENDTDNTDYWEYSEDQIESVVDGKVQNISDDLIGYLEGIYGDVAGNGFDEIYTAVENCIDEDSIIEDFKTNGSRENEISHYDGQENSIDYGGITYYIYRVG